MGGRYSGPQSYFILRQLDSYRCLFEGFLKPASLEEAPFGAWENWWWARMFELDGKSSFPKQCGRSSKPWQLERTWIFTTLHSLQTQVSNNWKSSETVEWLKQKGDPNRTHSIKKMPTHFAKQFGLKACNQRHSVLTWRRFPVAAKRKRPIPFNWQLSEAVFPVYVLKLFLSLGLEKKEEAFKFGDVTWHVGAYTHTESMGVYTRPSRGVQGMSIRILLACQWLFIDNSLNWVMQPSPRGSLTSSRRMHIYDLCIVLVDHLYTSRYATRCLGGADLTWPMCTSRYAAWCFWYVLSLLKPLQLCDALVPSWNLMFACAAAVLFEAKFGDSVYRRSVRINLLRLMF